MLTVLFTAVTAAGSAQLISVSSLVTYDVFRTYIKPSSTGRQLMRISRYSILGFGLGMGALASLLFMSGVSLQYVYLAMGVLIGSAVAPISLAILWKHQSLCCHFCCNNWIGVWHNSSVRICIFLLW